MLIPGVMLASLHSSQYSISAVSTNGMTSYWTNTKRKTQFRLSHYNMYNDVPTFSLALHYSITLQICCCCSSKGGKHRCASHFNQFSFPIMYMFQTSFPDSSNSAQKMAEKSRRWRRKGGEGRRRSLAPATDRGYQTASEGFRKRVFAKKGIGNVSRGIFS